MNENELIPLESIGFYTLSDNRAENASPESDMIRCEMLLTDRCNFKCHYCRGMKKKYRGDISMKDAIKGLALWISEGLQLEWYHLICAKKD